MEIEKPEDAPKETPLVPEANVMNKSTTKGAETKVQVALRVRPPISKEILNRESKCVECYGLTNQVIIIPNSCLLPFLSLSHSFCELNHFDSFPFI